jgi:uncharacterized membrane protein YfcA
MAMTREIHFLLAGFAAVSAGMADGLAGGGTLITFPILIFLGASYLIR